jgi:hypothetical protein
MKLLKLFFCVLSTCVAGSLFAAGPTHVFTPPVAPAHPDVAGRELVVRLLALQPAGGVTNGATLTNYLRKKFQSAVPLRLEVSVTESNWTTAYVQLDENSHDAARFVVVRNLSGPNEYYVESRTNGVRSRETYEGQAALVPIAGSQFTLADVGMEFLRWPTQRLLTKEICRTQACDKLESVAPEGWTNGYVRVISWFDIDTGGPVLVEAYNARGEKVKEFKPNRFKKVDGQFQVEELEMSDPRTSSRTTLRFQLNAS